MTTTTDNPCQMAATAAHVPSVDLNERLQRVLAIHFDPACGTAFWLERAAMMKIDPRRDVRQIDDLAMLGDMHPADLEQRPLRDFIPKQFHNQMHHFILGQTGGTTGGGAWTAYREDEFEAAFVTPFVQAAGATGFPRGGQWLFVGPSGPHIIGKAMRLLARATGAADPFSVDFDARWAKVLPSDSFAASRYRDHIVSQAMAVINSQQIDVLFTTPVILRRLAEVMTPAQRRGIRGVHYGGMALTAEELRTFQELHFPQAVHLSGYGNTLFGCCLELNAGAGPSLDYFPYGLRLHLEIVDEDGLPVALGETGFVRFTRLDESLLLVRMRERDLAQTVKPPANAPVGFVLPGVRNPHPPVDPTKPLAVGLY